MKNSIIASISVTAFLGIVACGGGSTSTSTSTSGGNSGTGGGSPSTGGKSGTDTSSNTGGNAGNTGGANSGGVTSGGSGGVGSGGSGGVTSGGGASSTGGKSTANTGGSAGSAGGANSGGVTTSGAGGATSGGGTPSTGGKSTAGTGGSAGKTGGAGSGGAAGGGATGTGGSAGSGGSAGTTGTTPSGLPLLITSTASALWQTGTITASSSGTATITVDDSKTFQIFKGFGGCFNEKGWSYLSQLAASDQAKAMTLLFDAQNGANFQYGRIPIGANDFSVTAYSDDDTSNDTSLASFSITEDQKYIIPYIQAAQAVNPNIHFWGSPWSPPGWMKSGGTGTSGLNQGTMKNDATTLTAYASYFVKWIQAYAAKNITIEAVAPQNEPNYSESYPSCQWKAADFNTFVGKYLGPALKSASLDTWVLLGTMSRNDTNSGTGESDQTVVTTVLGDSTSMGFIKAFGLQWNMMQKGAFIPSGAASSSLEKWQTEHKCGNYSWGGAAYGQTYNRSTAPNDFGYAEESWGNIHDWITTGVSVYSAWNMVLDPKGMSTANWPQDTLIVADPSAKTLTPKPAYYAFRHFSQYTQPGATRVGTTGDVACSADGIGKCNAGVAAVAFKNPDGTHVVTMFNTNTTSAAVVLAVGGTNLQFTMPATSFATVVN